MNSSFQIALMRCHDVVSLKMWHARQTPPASSDLTSCGRLVCGSGLLQVVQMLRCGCAQGGLPGPMGPQLIGWGGLALEAPKAPKNERQLKVSLSSSHLMGPFFHLLPLTHNAQAARFSLAARHLPAFPSVQSFRMPNHPPNGNSRFGPHPQDLSSSG